MDFMKTLLIYMTTVFAVTVQSTAAPSVTPEPVVTPTAVVESAEDSSPTMRIISGKTPEPEITPAPVPEITPNTAYHNIGMNARRSDVRKLQERLVEL